MSQQTKRLYEFGPFRIDTENRLLSRDGNPIALKPKVVDTLLMLIENSGRVVKKDELIEKLWPDTIVEEGNLTQNIYVLRKALDSGEQSESYIETIPRRGYRFAAQVKEISFEENVTLPAAPSESLPAIQEERDEKVVPATSLPARRRKTSNRWILISLVLLAGLLAVAGSYLLSRRANRAVTNTEIKSLAVLPFRPLEPRSHRLHGPGHGRRAHNQVEQQPANSRSTNECRVALQRTWRRPSRRGP